MPKKIKLPISGKEYEIPDYINRIQRKQILLSVKKGLDDVAYSLALLDAAFPIIFGITIEEADALPVPDAAILEDEIQALVNPEKKTS